jgi:hypothetical protein
MFGLLPIVYELQIDAPETFFMTQTTQTTHEELTRRHRSALIIVGVMFVLTLVLTVVALIAGDRLSRPGDPVLAMALWITILVFGMGAFVYRRTRFAAMRLQDVAALRGMTGLLATLQTTTQQIAYMAGAIALLGFIVYIMSGNKFDMVRAAGVSAIVLIYCYPQKNAWQRVVQGIERTGDANAGAVKGRTT